MREKKESESENVGRALESKSMKCNRTNGTQKRADVAGVKGRFEAVRQPQGSLLQHSEV